MGGKQIKDANKNSSFVTEGKSKCYLLHFAFQNFIFLKKLYDTVVNEKSIDVDNAVVCGI